MEIMIKVTDKDDHAYLNLTSSVMVVGRCLARITFNLKCVVGIE